MNWSVFPNPFRILWQAPVASNSCHSAQLLSLVFSFLFRIFQSPTRKSKSLLEEVFDGITSKSPVGVNDSRDITFVLCFLYFAKLVDDCFGNIVWRMRLIDRDTDRGMPVKGQSSLVSLSRRRFVRRQWARRAVLLNPPPAQVEWRVEPDGDSEARHQFAVFLPRDRAAAGGDDRGAT